MFGFGKKLTSIRELKREKLFSPIHLYPGDSIQFTWTDVDGTSTTLAKVDAIDNALIVTEAIIFEGLYEGRRALGAIALEQQS
jgi:hypothetical protein